MRIGVIIPTRGDRPEFLKNCLRQLDCQTVKPERISIINFPPKNDECDITLRYRIGYDHLCGKGLDVIALIEDDDWYSPNYLETMANEWIKRGKPDLIGTDHTIYYHIKLFAYFTMHHTQRSSAMSTLIKPDLDFPWCQDNEPYTDIHLWKILKGVIFTPENTICMGIKHGIGLCGGKSHVDRLHRYVNIDINKQFLQTVTDNASFVFYSNFFSSKAYQHNLSM